MQPSTLFDGFFKAENTRLQKFGGQTEPSGAIKKKVRVKREMWNRWSQLWTENLTEREMLHINIVLSSIVYCFKSNCEMTRQKKIHLHFVKIFLSSI